MKTRVAGFSLVELTIALAVMAVLATATIPYMQTKMEQARADKTADEMRMWLEAGLAYYSANNAWPADANVLVVGGYMTTDNLTNPWGGTYQLVPSGNSLQVSTTFNRYPLVGKEKLPLSSVAGNVVTASVVIPGTETAHARFLNRFGDNGQNVMEATLDLNGNLLDNATSIRAQAGSELAIRGATTTRIQSQAGTDNSDPENPDGSLNVNDIALRSLGAGNQQWLSHRLPKFAMMSSVYVQDGVLVQQPACATGGTPKIYLIPAGIHAEYVGVTQAAFQVWATRLGNLWRVNVKEYGTGNVIQPGGTAIAQIYCYFN